ncbi:MAG: hypothetical protein AB7G93_23410 [Bdellovibrionales bacterium]
MNISTGTHTVNQRNRTDRILVAVALAILLMATGLFYFDDWMWGNRRLRGESIGIVSKRSGDVRLKFEGDLKWQKASSGQDLVYNDAVYVGANSEAQLVVGKTQMTVTESTLVILRRDQNVNFLNLNYGTLFGRVGEGEKIVVDTGSGKPIELTTTKQAAITLRKVGNRTELDVTSGEADVVVDGQRRRIGKTEKTARVVVGEKVKPTVQPAKLLIVKPLHDQVIASEDPTRIEFAWEFDHGRPAAHNDRFTLEFAAKPDFAKIHAKKIAQGRMNTSMSVRESLSLYFRVRGPKGEISPIERVNFLRLKQPLIMKPLANQIFITPAKEKAPVEMEFRAPRDASIWFQVSTDPDFTKVLLNQNITDDRALAELPVGEYFVRARSDYGNHRTTEWTTAVPFIVEPKLEMLPLARRGSVPDRFEIPNRPYPASWYSASSGRVANFLAKEGTLRQFFPLSRSDFDTLTVELDGGRSGVFEQTTTAWPAQKLIPGQYKYRYQAQKQGFLPSAWSQEAGFELAVEPPIPTGEPKFGQVDSEGEVESQWAFTPLLFARTYDVEISDSAGFESVQEQRVSEPSVKTRLAAGTDYFWRARARDHQGRIISDFSRPERFRTPEAAPVFLAKREPAEVQKTITRVERVRKDNLEKSGWWAWLGTGMNYVDYRQSVPGRGTLTSQNIKAPSQYFEGGYVGSRGLGGVITYKNTPGELIFENAVASNAEYSWLTLGLEGIVRRTASLSLLDRPVLYGLRAGVQQHKTPFVFLDEEAELSVRENEMTTGSLGALAEWSRRRWTYYWSMRYQFPLSAKANGASEFEIKPTFGFDGSIGTSYNFTEQLKLGFFWYGQWHQYNFVYVNPEVTNEGFQSLFYSNIDLRLGFEF